jgi:tetratricopeptide (TPR) repeat protein
MKAVLLCLALATPLAQAAVFQDERLQRLYEQGRNEELEREARRLGGPEAAAAQALVLLAQGSDATPAAVRQAEACVQQHPQQAACHYALGSALGLQAQQQGVFKALRVVGRVKEAFGSALRLNPQLFEARSALQLVYLVLPALAGGSVDKARQLEAEVRDTQPEVAKLLRARLAAQAERWDEAERELAAVKPGSDRSFHNEWLNAWSGLARQWNKRKEHAKARERFEQLAQQLPQLAQPLYLLGRVAGDEGRHEEAIRLFERARALSGAPALPLDYRIGVAWMDLGERDKARAHLQRFVTADRGAPNNLDDARKRLKELG